MFKSKTLTKTLKSVIKKERRRVFTAKLKSHGSKSFWKTIGEVFKGARSDAKIEYSFRERVLNDDDEIADAFATFFEEKVSKLVSESDIVRQGHAQYACQEKHPWIPFSDDEIKKALSKVRNKRSCGPDEIPGCLINDCSELLVPHLKVIFNYCVVETWFPEEWKLAKITPIHKKGNKSFIENYRPVSNLSSLSKVFERCLLFRLDSYELDEDTQHGFRKWHSTTTAGLEVQRHLACGLDEKKSVAIYSLDMSAAFDLLRSELLVLKLSQVEGHLVSILVEFLKQRKAFVKHGQEHSKIIALDTGVPQGSVLGPKLFGLYTRGLKDVIAQHGVELVVYADDAYVIVSADNRDELVKMVENTLDVHIRWLRRHGMVVNTLKTELMSMGADIVVQFEGKNIISKDSMTVLGVKFDSKLSWTKHVKKTIGVCQSLKPALRYLCSRLSKNDLTKVITSHYFSRLYYGSEIWFAPLSCTNRKLISSMHYYALRLIIRDFKRCVSRPVIDSLTARASPNEFNNYKFAKMLINVSMCCAPYVLFQDLLTCVTLERRSEKRPRFFDTSKRKIGRQSFSNRASAIAKMINFDWNGIDLSPGSLRTKLKDSFFTYKSL